MFTDSSASAGIAAFLAAAGFACAAYVYVLHRRLRAQYLAGRRTFVRNQAIIDASGEGVLELDAAGRVLFANPAAVRMLGFDADELSGRDYGEFMTAAVEESTRAAGRLGYTTDMVRGIGAVLRCKNGRHRPVEYRMVAVRDAAERAAGSVIAFRDLSERVRIDLMLADMQYTAQVGAWELPVGGLALNVTEGVSHHLGLPPGRPIPLKRLVEIFRIDDLRRINRAAQSAVATGQSLDLELRLASAQETWVRCIGKAERVDGRTTRLYGTVQNVTERKLAERILRETRDFFGASLDAMPSLVMHVSAARQVTYCNQSPLRVLLACREPAGESLQTVLGSELNAQLAANISAALGGEARSDLRSLECEDEHHEVQLNFVPEHQLGNGIRGCFVVFTDVTELKRLEERLRHAEKMQVIGQLTGGVAHDFNNLLGVIIGNLQLMERDVGKSSTLSKKLNTAMRAALRGGDLTRRLLTFARRQIHEPTVLDLKHQLGSFNELMQRTLGESIETRLVFAPDLWRVRVDSVQLESAILNLAINARDAMPQGGVLTVEARNVHIDAPNGPNGPDGSNGADAELPPGDYVRVQVSDTGSGIPPDILARVFDPFFTTKESGKGSGLGLSIVQGFAKQAGGTATIASELGRGTTVSILLPSLGDAQAAHEDTIVLKQMPGGSETILLVEDDSDLRATASATLQQLGYRVLECANGEAAVRVLEREHDVELLFTDIMMPGGMLGTVLAQRARQINPKIHVLFTTGYIDDAALAEAQGMTAEGIIPKPYRNEELALKVRYLLDQEERQLA